MSFILDALKKSEIERQRQAIPGFMGPGAPAPRPRFPFWAVGLVALLGINLVVLLIVLTRGGAPSVLGEHASKPATEVPRPAAATPAAPAAPGHFSPLDAAPVYAPEIPAAEEVIRANGEPAAGKAMQGAAHAPALPANHPIGGTAPSHAARPVDPVLTADDDKSDQEVLPSMSEINLAGQNLPDLHLDVHVYATKPAERFVYINMRKYREGAALEEGPTVERIRRDGVVLSYNGLRFVLPRQQ
jgi:general secretion pathway protein B